MSHRRLVTPAAGPTGGHVPPAAMCHRRPCATGGHVPPAAMCHRRLVAPDGPVTGRARLPGAPGGAVVWRGA